MIKVLQQWLIKSYFFLLFLGLVIRLISIKTKGMEDVDVMINWGINISNLGWDEGYQAIYFPTSHIIFNTIGHFFNYSSCVNFSCALPFPRTKNPIFWITIGILSRLFYVP